MPLPVPVSPLVTVIHELLLTAFHEQPLVEVTATEPVPPEALKFCELGLMANEQEALTRNR